MAARVLTDDDLEPLRREVAELRESVRQLSMLAEIAARWAGVPKEEIEFATGRPVAVAIKPRSVRPGWKKNKALAMKRAAWHCEQCGTDRAIQVHHVKPRSDGGTDDLDNLKVLCATCHDVAHRNLRRESAAP